LKMPWKFREQEGKKKHTTGNSETYTVLVGFE
jgi:hypothetical protein